MKKLLVVTGGSKGIGKAIIEKFASNQFDIVTCSRNEQDLEILKKEIETKHQVAVFFRKTDMSVKGEVQKFAEFVSNLKRRIDVLVNNSGFFVPGEILTEPEGVLEQTMNANLYSAYYMTRGLIQDMRKEKNGHIFNICSIASLKAYPNGGSYAITKAALLGFSRCIREELKSDGIRVTAVMPGATKTASWDGVDLPDSRFMKVEDVAEAIYSAYSISSRSVVEEIIIRPQLGDI